MRDHAAYSSTFLTYLYVKLKFAGIFGQGEAENPHRDGAREGPFVHVRVRVRLGVQRQEHSAAAHGEEAQPLCQEDEDAAVPELTPPSLDDSILSPPTYIVTYLESVMEKYYPRAWGKFELDVFVVATGNAFFPHVSRYRRRP